MALSFDELNSAVIFARVVELQSFSAAAADLRISKSLVSARVAALEQRMGTRLLNRTTRKLSLTPDGQCLYERCVAVQRSAAAIQELFERTSTEPAGVLRVTAPEPFCGAYLSQSVPEFLRRYPGVRLELSGSNHMVNLVEQRVDVAIRIAPQVKGQSLVTRKLAVTPKVVCASPQYLRREGVPQHVRELSRHACLRFTPLPAHVEWRFLSAEGEIIVPVSGPLCSDNLETVRHAALAGMGLAVLSVFCIHQDLREGRLVPVLRDYELDELGVFAVYSEAGIQPARAQAFVNFMASLLRSPPWKGVLETVADARSV